MVFQTLKFRLVLIGCIALVASTILRFAIVLPYTQQQIQELVSTQQLAFASYVARDIGQQLDMRRQLIGHLAKTMPPDALLKPDRFAEWVSRNNNADGLRAADNLLLLDLDGNIKLHSMPLGPAFSPHSFSKDAWFQQVMNPERSSQDQPESGPALVGSNLVIASPVRDASRHVVAILAGVFSLPSLGAQQNAPKNPIGKTGGLLLVSPDIHQYIGSSDPAMVLKPTPAPGANPLHDRAVAGYRGAGVAVNAKGEEELEAIASVPRSDWFVVAHMLASEALQPIHSLKKAALQGSVFGAVLLLTAIFFIVSRLLYPVTGTTKAMREIADGKRELLPLTGSQKDEIGSFIQGFNYMVTRLREKESELRASETRLSFLAHHDPLTGLCNRAMLEQRIQKALSELERGGKPFALFFCDLDGFKHINDVHGHEVGDSVLIRMATLFRQESRPSDTVARLGGDEFVILLANIENAREDAACAAMRLLEVVQEPFTINDHTFTLSASIGITISRSPSDSSSKLLSQADIAMYHAKRTGKNRVHFFDDTAVEAALEA